MTPHPETGRFAETFEQVGAALDAWLAEDRVDALRSPTDWQSSLAGPVPPDGIGADATLQEFIDFDGYVRCFTFGKRDIMPVRYDPKARQYLVDHEYLSAELGARVVADAQTINEALGYEMNTIEFAIKDGVPYAIDFLNPAPDFERDRITEFYFAEVVERMAKLVIDRATSGAATNPWPRWEQMIGMGQASGVVGQPAPGGEAQR